MLFLHFFLVFRLLVGPNHPQQRQVFFIEIHKNTKKRQKTCFPGLSQHMVGTTYPHDQI